MCYLPILTAFGWCGGRRVQTRPPGLRQGTTVCVHTCMDMEQQSDHKLIRPSGMELLVCGAGSRPSYHLGVVKKELPTGVNLNHYDGSKSCVRWHSDNESLFGPRDSPKLIVSLSLGNPVEFKVRRVSDSVTSSITLNHGDVLVMDGSAQSEYLHCTMPGLQGPRVNLTYRWVAQHTASCPLAGVVGCLLPIVCARFRPSQVLDSGRKGKIIGLFPGDCPFFCSS